MLKTLEIILRLIEWWFVDWHQENAQKSRDSLEANPADWFEQHFDGLRDDTSTKPKADKTNTKN